MSAPTAAPALKVSRDNYSDGSQRGLLVEGLPFPVKLLYRRPDGSRDFYKTTRVYGGLAALVAGFDAEEDRLFNAITDHSAKDPGLAAFQRRSAAVSSRLLPAELARVFAALRELGISVLVSDEFSARFSRKAGCSMCPCSPGHVLSVRVLVNGRPVDVYLD